MNKKNSILIRKARPEDKNAIRELYLKVADEANGLARIAEEITDEYVQSFCEKATTQGLQLVAIDTNQQSQIIGELHCHAIGPNVFRHVWGELTVAVDSAYRGVGVGHGLFEELLNHVTQHCPDISRVELIVRESNRGAIALYEKLGFRQEGRLTGRILNASGELEDDIPMAWIRPVQK